MYRVIHGEEELECNKRAEAIRLARNLSLRRRRTGVRVVRKNGRERMVYRNGILQEGIHLAPGRRL